jgi:hypothetical protein
VGVRGVLAVAVVALALVAGVGIKRGNEATHCERGFVLMGRTNGHHLTGFLQQSSRPLSGIYTGPSAPPVRVDVWNGDTVLGVCLTNGR